MVFLSETNRNKWLDLLRLVSDLVFHLLILSGQQCPLSWLSHLISNSRTHIKRLLVDQRQGLGCRNANQLLKFRVKSYFTWDIQHIISVLPYYLHIW